MSKLAPMAIAQHLFDDIAPSNRMAFERVLDSLTARMLSEDSQRMRNADK